MSTLIQTSKRLQVDRITAIVRDLREPRAALRRIGVLLIYSAVVQLVAERGSATGLQPEAQHVLGVLYAFLLISVGWAALLHRSKDLQEKAWIDVAGSLVNFIGIAILLRVGWNVMLPFVAALPLCCITIGALHNRKEFFVSLLFSVLVVFTSAPSGYWLTRPFVGMLAAALLVGLPLTVMRLMRGLREVSIEAVKARDAHSRFLASMSHELRTPLNSVVAASEALQTDEHPERRRQLMHLLAVNALVLQNRVNDVLDVRAIEAGRLAIKIQPFTFAGVLKTVSAVVTPQARSKVIDLKFIAGDAKDVVLRSAPDRLEQMLTNLVTNAIKFTPEHGRVEVRVQLFPAKDNLVNAHVTVSDTGIGIPMEVRKKIFDPFFQVNDGISSRVTDGVGLGLFIVSGIAKLMGGVIDVEDNEGGGSVFNLFLSMERAAPGERPSQTLEQREALADHRRKVRQLHCLVVDDNASNREIAARLMHRAGHTLVLASNGDEAIKRLESEPFDVMFLDLFMPGKTGWVVLDHFQEQRAKGKAVPPIVVMSADANPEAMDAASEKGAMTYILKPISFGKILPVLETIDARKFGTVADVPRKEQPEAFAWIDFLRAEGNPDALIHFIETCLAGIDFATSKLGEAKQARDHAQCLHYAHALKNEFVQLGFNEGIAACDRFPERLARGEMDPAYTELTELTMQIERQMAAEVTSNQEYMSSTGHIV